MGMRLRIGKREPRCRGCGHCCDPVPFNVGKRRAELRAVAVEGSDQAFILAHWHVIRGDWRSRCDLYDRKTRRCLIHPVKPHVCADYPFYRDHSKRKWDCVPVTHDACAFAWFDRHRRNRTVGERS